MLPDSLVAGFSIVLLAALLLVNIYNIGTTRKSPRPVRRSSRRAEETNYFYLAAFGTLVFGVDSLLFPFIALTGFLSFVNAFPFRIAFLFDEVVQVGGLALLTAGYSLFAWSVIARGRYAVSWDMPEDHKLVTWGPYRCVRHPSYLAYTLMFLGLVLTWLNLLAVPGLIGIIGYYRVIDSEEKILLERFGDEYRRYQERTGRLLPRPRKRQQT